MKAVPEEQKKYFEFKNTFAADEKTKEPQLEARFNEALQKRLAI